jgi:ribosomal protein S18 acetylase RimI-like enzyme
MRLICTDWREAAPEQTAALYKAEARRWSVLEWDTTSNWEEVERGRQRGLVPGVIVSDDRGKAVGWSYYIIHHRTLQIGGFVSSSEAVSARMLDAILTPEALAAVDAVTFFAYTNAPDIAPALRSRGLSVDRYWYFGRDLDRGTGQSLLPQTRRWRLDDVPATAQLLRRAYEQPSEARPFAPRGTWEEWLDYVVQMTGSSGCGSLIAEACVALPAGPDRLSGVAIVTRIGVGVGHIAQLAVDPSMQGRGLGASLLEAACAAAERADCRRVTLLVGGRNERARRLYEGAGFRTGESFLAAGTFQPLRPSRAATVARAIGLR